MRIQMQIARTAAIVGMALAWCGIAAAADADDVKKAPGYVDFGALNVFGSKEADKTIFIEQGLMQFIAAAVAKDDPELADMLSKLLQIRVQTFAIEADKLEAIEKKTQEMSKKLEGQGWTTMVKMIDARESGQTFIYSKMVDGKMQGLVVMNVEPKDDASFINIVGEIDPEQLGKLQSRFGAMHGLDSLNIQLKNKYTDDKQKERDKGHKSD